MPIDRKDYEFTKQAARSAYENAIRDAVGEGGMPLPDVDQHLHPDYALVDHGHKEFEHVHPEYAEEEHLHPEKADLEHEHLDLSAQIEHNEDRINALEHELDAIADTKETGEWELVSILDFDIRGSGQMTLANDDFGVSNNEMTLHETDKNGLSHGFSGVEPGDLVEVVEEHIARSTGDYGLYEVKSVNGMTFSLELQQGRGTAETNKNFFIKFFHLSEDVNIAELDARYALKGHTHDNYIAKAADNSTYKDWLVKADGNKKNPADFAGKSHTHGSSHTPPGRQFVFGSATNTGEFYADGSGNVYFNREDKNGIVRVMPSYPDFAWATPCKITVWDNESGYLKYACEAGKSSDYKTDTIVFKNGKLLYNKALVTGLTYYVVVEGYW